MNNGLYLGIDGGGSRTRAWLVRADGEVMGCGESGPSNVHRLGTEASVSAIVSAVAQARRDANLPENPLTAIDAMFAGVAGAGARGDQRALAADLSRRLGIASESCGVSHDLRIALAGAFGTAEGAVLIAGTGSACYGCAGGGRESRSGGWGMELDDGGSGSWLGNQAMRAVVRTSDGRLAPNEFSTVIKTFLDVAGPREIIDRLRDGAWSREKIARLAPVVLQRAESGDPVATEIVGRGAGELAGMAVAVVEQIRLPDARVAGVGGLLENSVYYRDAVAAAIRQRTPGVRLVAPDAPPIVGACVLALQHGGIVIDAATRARLIATGRKG